MILAMLLYDLVTGSLRSVFLLQLVTINELYWCRYTIKSKGHKYTSDCNQYTSYRNHDYGNDPKFLGRQIWTNSADPDQTAPDQGLHCLQFWLHLLGAILFGKAILLKF